ncbi:U2_small nuclear ribonucleoprotein A' [Hexamita inflata]|uniref:Putative n=1 Tax=Hexamita inflata TaxID=28002 RepID=A0AA86TH81_9EUKA|nr:U2 small nuclear ribonucleoprotein A' [Hexamita inflata]
MVKITAELLRKRSEHNEGVLETLEEIALHQFKIRRIEALNQLTPRLKILLLQNNKIRKIENLNRLKSLVYLNLAINRITRLENLESLESLRKLDLTVNYIYDYRDFQCLSGLTQLEELHVMGNPCESQPYFKEYLLVHLQNLKRLNGTEISRADRIEASQLIKLHREEVAAFKFFPQNPEWDQESDNSDYEDNDQAIRIKRAAQQSAAEEVQKKVIEKKRTKGMTMNGTILQWNDTGFKYEFDEIESTQEMVLKIHLPEHLSTEYVKVDVEMDWIYVQIKERSLQLRLDRRVHVDQSRVVRVTSTGVLKIYMKVFEEDRIISFKKEEPKPKHDKIQDIIEKESGEDQNNDKTKQDLDVPDDLPDLI